MTTLLFSIVLSDRAIHFMSDSHKYPSAFISSSGSVAGLIAISDQTPWFQQTAGSPWNLSADVMPACDGQAPAPASGLVRRRGWELPAPVLVFLLHMRIVSARSGRKWTWPGCSSSFEFYIIDRVKPCLSLLLSPSCCPFIYLFMLCSWYVKVPGQGTEPEPQQ